MKSSRPKTKQDRFARANTPQAKARTRALREAAKLLGPAPCYEAYRPGDDVITITIQGRGWVHVVQADVPPDRGRNRARSDQHVVTINGTRQPGLQGLVGIFNAARKAVPRRLSRGELATM